MSFRNTWGCILSKFYIKPQLKFRTAFGIKCCILSKFYIKPQLCSSSSGTRTVVSYRNSTSNHNLFEEEVSPALVVSYRNSTSNHNKTNVNLTGGIVVSYRNSTSNHNKPPFFLFGKYVVSYRNSTSNHNTSQTSPVASTLYLIEILHQTTTTNGVFIRNAKLYLIEILHQTTTVTAPFILFLRCILSKFYIKPQRRASY